jgi:hypothetical protein
LLGYNAFTKLSLAFFSNLTKSANTAAKGGLLNTIKGCRRLVLKKEAVIDKPLCKKYDGCNYAIKQYCGGFDSSAVSQLGCYRI